VDALPNEVGAGQDIRDVVEGKQEPRRTSFTDVLDSLRCDAHRALDPCQPSRQRELSRHESGDLIAIRVGADEGLASHARRASWHPDP